MREPYLPNIDEGLEACMGEDDDFWIQEMETEKSWQRFDRLFWATKFVTGHSVDCCNCEIFGVLQKQGEKYNVHRGFKEWAAMTEIDPDCGLKVKWQKSETNFKDIKNDDV